MVLREDRLLSLSSDTVTKMIMNFLEGSSNDGKGRGKLDKYLLRNGEKGAWANWSAAVAHAS